MFLLAFSVLLQSPRPPNNHDINNDYDFRENLFWLAICELFTSLVWESYLLNDDRYGEGRKLPLAIMVSDDTAERTRDMLEKGDYFGMEKDQVTIMKQEKVAAIQVTY